MVNVFISYSHKDEEMRNELENHLAILKRQGTINLWHDRRIGAGKEIDAEIDKHLLEADIILLLVSSYFLNSDYCYDIELKKAMERHERNEARVIPIILHSCLWNRAPFGKLLAVPTDGKPISKYPNQHDAFCEIARAIEKAADETKLLKGKTATIEPITTTYGSKENISHKLRSSNLRLKKNFTDREMDKFIQDAFEYMAKFFEGSLDELQRRNPDIETDFRRIDANKFSASIYIHGSSVSYCTIRLTGRDRFSSSITYSITDSDSSYNESLSVKNDGYQLFLEPLGMFWWGDKKPLTFEGGAEYYWGRLIEPLQI